MKQEKNKDKHEAVKAGDKVDSTKVASIGSIVGGVASSIGTPLVVNGLGFTASGIASGSAGAAIMSAEAIAAGGGVAAGGVTATLQTIGTTGLLAAGTPVVAGIIGVGAVLGGAAGLGWQHWMANKEATKENDKEKTSNKENEEIYHICINLVLSSSMDSQDHGVC
eukprot:CAMPEP_0116834792 /NCGR_PEP_ID=MMETSP0418-20121206/7183_1 /TAXON_ID=1158023 /ORGANISM="Astrosyne radiata, Strain 13vi08-1A" /LENGTH=165 /DNA_ID=CAMNT_0004464381 /DNA_START=274 /DNA_END=771 /DNA_ORIENTATION=+